MCSRFWQIYQLLFSISEKFIYDFFNIWVSVDTHKSQDNRGRVEGVTFTYLYYFHPLKETLRH